MAYKFLIYISYSYSVPIGNPLELEIKERKDEVRWFSDEKDGAQAIADKENVIASIEEVIAYRPDIVLVATDNVPHFISGLKVQVFHGFFTQKRPSRTGKFAHFRIRNFFDLYCTHGPSTTQKFNELAELYKHFTVKETGFSKVDPLFPLEPTPILDKPVVLISSTFTVSKSLALKEEVFKRIKSLSEAGRYRFIMVLHPKLEAEVKAKWKTIENHNFKYHDTTNLIPLFKKSHIMLSDTTSAIQEYLLQKKPVVAINHTFKHNYIVHVDDINLLEEKLDFALTYPKPLIKEIETFIKQLHPYDDGKSSKRIVDAAIELLENYPVRISKKPFNLIRKFKIRKKLNYWKF